MSKHSSDPYYEPVQLMKSFRMGTGQAEADICRRVIKYMKEEKDREIYKQTPKHPYGSKFSGDVIMTGESVRVNLYNANDKDAVNFGIYHDRMWGGRL